jgi:hypothetical protein
MKRFYVLLTTLGLGSVAFAQSAPKHTFHKPANQIDRRISTEKTTGTYLIDMEGVQQSIIGDVQSFVDLSLNSYDTTENNMHAIWQVVDTLQITPEDYSTLDYIPRSNVLTMMVDSAFIIFGHQNNSGAMDKIRFRLTNVVNVTGNGNTYYDWDTELWSDSIMTDTSLTGVGTGTGYPIASWGFAVNTAVPSPYKFGFEVTYDAPQEDSIAVRYSYATDGANCPGNAQAPNIVQPEIYPSAYYSITLGGGTPGDPQFTYYLPRKNDGAYYWYIDCDGSGDGSGDATENPYHYWSIWFKVTITDNVGIAEQTEKGIRLYNYPNPANTTTTINFDLKNAADVNLYISDISGKVVSVSNLGHRNSGANTYVLNTENLSAGIYMYTLDVDGTKITRRMVISK